MKYTPLSKTLFERNRKAFSAKMKPNSIALFHANEIVNNNADGAYRFVQDSNMYYLSGIDQEEVILLLFPDAPKDDWKEVLFIRNTNEHIQQWEGWKYSKEEAKEASGVETVYFYSQFQEMLHAMIPYFDGVYIDINEQDRSSHYTFSAAHRFAELFRNRFPAHQIYRSAPILRALRMIKQAEELIQIETACQITEKAFRRILSFVEPGLYEYEIEAEIIHEFLRNRATGPAFETIVASGKNACVLHYILNNAQCQSGDLLLMDFGAEYGHYSADMTRTIPVNGRFSDRQKDVYNAVLRVMQQAKQKLVPGNHYEEYHEEVGGLMQEELLSLGLLTKEDITKAKEGKKPYKKYYMHGTSHHLGLDTHDEADKYATFREGMVFTCEPGIYIPEEAIGIRLENDILIREDGPLDLMATIPIEVIEIETLMAEKAQKTIK